jgi:hypothetical protein
VSYGGSVQSMINTLRSNSRLLRRKSTFTILREEIERIDNRNLLKGRPLTNHKPLTSELKAQLKASAKESLKKDRVSSIIGLAISLVVTVGIVYIFYPTKTNSSLVISKKEHIEYLENKRKYEFYINDGYKWLNKQNYHNAIFQFELATKIDKHNFLARLGLTSALAGSCFVNSDKCDKANSEFLRFMKDYNEADEKKRLNSFLKTIGDTTRVKQLNEIAR